MTRSLDQIQLIGKQFSGAGGYERGDLNLRVEKTITSTEWNTLHHLLHQAAFWEMPSVEPQPVSQDGAIIVMMDGASWMVEGIQDGQRHLVQRSFIMEYPEFQQACLYLVTLSEIPVPPEEVY